MIFLSVYYPTLLCWLTSIGITNSFNLPKKPTKRRTQLWESPVKFAGTGPRQVDMNQYNIPLDQIEQEWTANLVAKTIDTDGGIFLGVKNDRELFVDVLKVTLPRTSDGGMGIGLVEIAGGREDGLGITLVSDLVKGGLAEKNNADVMPGDSISNIAIVRRQKEGTGSDNYILADTEETINAKTECLGYDATVDSILSLPPLTSSKETYVLTVKRIRRKPTIKVNLKFPPQSDNGKEQYKQPDTTIELFAGENLRLGMLVRGVQLNDAFAKRFDTKAEGNCGAGGLCRTCVVSVLRGKELLSPQKTAEAQMLEKEPRWRLSCKSFVGYGMKEGEITVQVAPQQW